MKAGVVILTLMFIKSIIYIPHAVTKVRCKYIPLTVTKVKSKYIALVVKKVKSKYIPLVVTKVKSKYIPLTVTKVYLKGEITTLICYGNWVYSYLCKCCGL